MRIYLVTEIGTEKPPAARRSFRAAAALARNAFVREGRLEVKGAQRGFLRVVGVLGSCRPAVTRIIDVQPVELAS